MRFALDPKVVFLNHGSFGACPVEILDRQRELQLELEAEPVRFLGRELEGRLDAARVATARFLNANPEGFAWMRNATQGVNTVLKSLRFQPGDELLVTNQEYNACRNVLDFVASRDGATVRVVTVPFPISDPAQVTEAIVAGVNAKTKLLLVDWITSPTGLIFPIHDIVHAMRSRGVLTLVDAAHAPGQVEMDLEALGAEFVTGNFHKWLNTPKGSAFLHVRHDWTHAIRPLSISHGANSPRTDRSRFLLEFGFCGTEDLSPWLLVPETIRLFEKTYGSWDALRAKQKALALSAREILLECFELRTPPAPDSMVGSMVAFPLPKRWERRLDGPIGDPRGDGMNPHSPTYFHRFQERLFEEHRIEVPIFFWKESERMRWSLRISSHMYNSLADYERLKKAWTVVSG